jgi:ribose 1,5-bisphosphokinase PhnN
MSPDTEPSPTSNQSNESERRAYADRDILVTRFSNEILAILLPAAGRELNPEEQRNLTRRYDAKVDEFFAASVEFLES